MIAMITMTTITMTVKLRASEREGHETRRNSLTVSRYQRWIAFGSLCAKAIHTSFSSANEADYDCFAIALENALGYA
jgi:hypothetical protein